MQVSVTWRPTYKNSFSASPPEEEDEPLYSFSERADKDDDEDEEEDAEPGMATGCAVRSSDTGWAGTACMVSCCIRFCGLREKTRTVLSKDPTTRKGERERPSGMGPSESEATSAVCSSFRSRSRSWPCSSSK